MRIAKKKLETTAEVYDCALNLLSFREHSQKELRQKLAQKGAEKEQIDEAVVRLLEYGLLDDERYAQHVYESWLNKKVYGRQHLLAELNKKFVPKEYSFKVLNQFTEAVESTRAELAVQQFCRTNRKKLETALQSADPKNKQRLYAALIRYLVSRGFGSNYLEMAKHHIDAEFSSFEEE